MKNVILGVVITILVAIIVVLGFLLFDKNQKGNSRNVEIDNIKVDASGNRKITSGKKEVVQDNMKDDCLGKNEVYFPIPELGIKVPVDKSVKDDLIYRHKKNPGYGEYVYVSFKSLIRKIGGNEKLGDCSLASNGAFVISKESIDSLDDTSRPTRANALESIKQGRMKRIGNEFISVERQDMCSYLDAYEDKLISSSANVIIENTKCIKSINN